MKNTVAPGQALSHAALQASLNIEAYLANVKQFDRLICDFVSTLYTQVRLNGLYRFHTMLPWSR